MFRHTQINILPLLTLVLFVLLLPGPVQVGALPEKPVEPEALLACPAAPAGLPNSIDRPNFCVFYSNNNTAEEATDVADYVQEYWDRYVTDFGFSAPLATGKLGVHLLDIPGDCNGCGNCVDNAMTVYSGCLAIDECIQKVVGHELFHRVQYSYDSVEAKWMKEGTARAMEDNAFDNIDNWSQSITQTLCASYNQQVNTYLASPNNDITTDAMKYNSAMWWKYLEEQYGTTAGEPQLGVDAFRRTWEAAAAANNLAAVNNAMALMGGNFNTSFRRFTVANWTKDLTGVPDASYNYVDEDQTGNPGPYGPLTPAEDDDGIINIGDPATWNGQNVSSYGARYYMAAPGATCPLISASFHKISGPDVFYHVITQKGSVFASHREGSGTDWTQSYLNDGITQITAIIGGQANSATVDVAIACANPVVDIKLPNDPAVAYVGPAGAPGKFLAQVAVTNGSPTGPVVAGLTSSDFKAWINGIEGVVTTGGFIQEQYWLEIEAPAQAANGTYDLEIVLEAPGTSTEIASDTSADSITYSPDNTDQVLVVDRSGSMGEDSKMLAAQDAAAFYIDVTRNLDGLAMVPFQHDVMPAPFAMDSVDNTVRNNAKIYVRALTPGTTTSIGDGLAEAVSQRSTSPTGNPRCSFVLLSDGMENTAKYWSEVQADVVNSHCPVTTIAFGPDSNETLMQNIATATGGLSFYNDVYTSVVGLAAAGSVDAMALELSNNYEYAQSRAEGRQRLFFEQGSVPIEPVVQEHKFLVDKTATEVIFALDWNQRGVEMLMQLVDPKGNLITPRDLPYTFVDYQSGHLGWRISNPLPGTWSMLVTHQGGAKDPVSYQVLSSAHTDLTLELLLLDRTGRRFFTGNRVPIYAFLSASKPIPDARVLAFITAPDGTLTKLRLFDDGQHGDGAAGDGFYGNVFTRVNRALISIPSGEDAKQPEIMDEGAYRVRVIADHEQFRREAYGSFSVLEGEDANQNGMPDLFEKEYDVSDPKADPDLDGLDNLNEYWAGTDPNNSDTDGGGENDGSEVLKHQLDPLDAGDDQIEAPVFFRADPDNGKVRLTYDVKKEYVSMVLYRATSPNGPWSLRTSNLPLTGEYSDPAVNGIVYYYRLMAIDDLDHRSAVIASEPVKPALDPIPPEARVIMEHGAPSTRDLTVVLSFAAIDLEDGGLKAFEDITEMMISNDPFFTGAKWQTFAQDVSWQLAPTKPNTPARVYVLFRDAAGNPSVGAAVGTILYQQAQLFLPTIMK
jgi:hypothetical protein